MKLIALLLMAFVVALITALAIFVTASVWPLVTMMLGYIAAGTYYYLADPMKKVRQ